MKKFLLFCSVLILLVLSGCLEITDEISLNKDGSGVMVSTTDMSSLMSMMKSMGGADAMGDNQPIDTTFFLQNLADSVSSLTAEEKKLVKKGKLGLVVDVQKEKMMTRIEIPFSKAAQIDRIRTAAAKLSNYIMSKSAGDDLPPGLDGKLDASDPMAGYFTTTYARGVIEKKLNREKYQDASGDEALKGLKEMADNGMDISNIIVINLPAEAKSATGKNVSLSENKRKVSIKTSTEDFFENPAAMEFRIEY